MHSHCPWEKKVIMITTEQTILSVIFITDCNHHLLLSAMSMMSFEEPLIHSDLHT